jgi:hypothetical protein
MYGAGASENGGNVVTGALVVGGAGATVVVVVGAAVVGRIVVGTAVTGALVVGAGVGVIGLVVVKGATVVGVVVVGAGVGVFCLVVVVVGRVVGARVVVGAAVTIGTTILQTELVGYELCQIQYALAEIFGSNPHLPPLIACATALVNPVKLLLYHSEFAGIPLEQYHLLSVTRSTR